VAALLALLLALLALGPGGGSSEIEAAPGAAAPERDAAASLTPREKAALVVVSGLPDPPPGVAGVMLHGPTARSDLPRDALVFVDQEGGEVRRLPSLPPTSAASAYRTRAEARRAGTETGRALRSAGVDVNFAPVLDAASGPLGARHFVRPELGLAFARGLARGGTAPCVKHFPGLGTAPISTDLSPDVRARATGEELQAFTSAIRAGAPCVMVSHAFYERFGARRASFSPQAYELLRRMGFDGVAITDSVSVFGSDYATETAELAIGAGADLLLYTNGRDAARGIRALLPLARAGELDERVRRVLRLRRELGLRTP
jgi:beta-N-acetylhexosaminidase